MNNMEDFNLKEYLGSKKLLKENFGNSKKKNLNESETRNLDTGELDPGKVERFLEATFSTKGDDFEEALEEYIFEISQDNPEYDYTNVNDNEMIEDFLEFADHKGFEDIGSPKNTNENQELNEESELKFSQVKEGKIYTACENFGIFQIEDEVMVDTVRNIGQEVVLELKNADGENDSIKGDLSEPVEVFK